MTAAFSMQALDPENLNDREQAAQVWFEYLRDQICQKFMDLKHLYFQTHLEATSKQFTYTPRTLSEGSGGTMGLMKESLFEKVGANVSTVWRGFASQV